MRGAGYGRDGYGRENHNSRDGYGRDGYAREGYGRDGHRKGQYRYPNGADNGMVPSYNNRRGYKKNMNRDMGPAFCHFYTLKGSCRYMRDCKNVHNLKLVDTFPLQRDFIDSAIIVHGPSREMYLFTSVPPYVVNVWIFVPGEGNKEVDMRHLRKIEFFLTEEEEAFYDEKFCFKKKRKKKQIFSLLYAEECLFAGLDNGAIKIMHLPSSDCSTLYAHDDGVYSILCIDGIIVSSSILGDVKFWKYNETTLCFEAIKTVETKTKIIKMLEVAPPKGSNAADVVSRGDGMFGSNTLSNNANINNSNTNIGGNVVGNMPLNNVSRFGCVTGGTNTPNANNNVGNINSSMANFNNNNMNTSVGNFLGGTNNVSACGSSMTSAQSGRTLWVCGDSITIINLLTLQILTKIKCRFGEVVSLIQYETNIITAMSDGKIIAYNLHGEEQFEMNTLQVYCMAGLTTNTNVPVVIYGSSRSLFTFSLPEFDPAGYILDSREAGGSAHRFHFSDPDFIISLSGPYFIVISTEGGHVRIFKWE